jgi:hypothetical protein
LCQNFDPATLRTQSPISNSLSNRLTQKKKQRQSWIKALKKGNNPITEEVLQSLKGQ